MKNNKRNVGLSVLLATVAVFFSQSISASDSVSGSKGKYRWSITYIKTETSRKQLVYHYKCVIKSGDKVVRTEAIVSNGKWLGREISNTRARKNAADACKTLAAAS